MDMPLAGFKWTDHFIPGSTKILIGLFANSAPGEGHEGIWKQRYHLYQLVGDTMPDAIKFIKTHGTHKDPIEEVLCRRAVKTRPKDRGGNDELLRFQKPDWEPQWNLMNGVCRRPRRLHMDELMETQEKVLITRYTGFSGVYILQDSIRPNRNYVGESGKEVIRARQHSEFYRIVMVYPTADKQSAVKLQDNLHDALKAEHPRIFSRPGSKGAYDFPDEQGVEYIHRLMVTHHRHDFHQTNRIVE